MNILKRFFYKYRGNRPCFGGEYATLGDIEELLFNPWITRLWTYQEILLASNPIVVCGDSHLSWPIFERSVLFLDNALRYHLWYRAPSGMTTAWVTTALIRERLQRATESFSRTPLKDYITFVRETSKASRWLALIQLLLPPAFFLVAYVLSGVISAQRRPTKRLLFACLIGASVLIGTVCLVDNLIHQCVRMLARLGKTSEEVLAIGLYSRVSTNPKDMAFGMWAILKKLGAVNLRDPDYSQDIGNIYRTLAVQIVHLTQSLDPLFLAAIEGVADQPSWVPDWSEADLDGWIGHVERFMKRSNLPGRIFSPYYGPFKSAKVVGATRHPAIFEFDEAQAILTVQVRSTWSITICASAFDGRTGSLTSLRRYLTLKIFAVRFSGRWHVALAQQSA
jgi:hypothetical protein